MASISDSEFTENERVPLIGRSITSYNAFDKRSSQNLKEKKACLKSLSYVTQPTNDVHRNGSNGRKQEPGDVTAEHVAGVTIVTDRIAYTWHEMNVFTNERRRRRWNDWPWRRSQTGVAHCKHILKNVSGAAYPGELLAIIGSSGAGKTTLLNTLMFRSPASVAVTGQRAMNGIPVDSSTLASLSAYVQQNDLFVGTLTVKEHLIFHSLLRMDRDIPYHRRSTRVEQVICEFGLTNCQNTYIGVPGRLKGISGGEMKRLSFASEVLTNPPLMFCDEPTSGLDSFMALNVVSVMKDMALKGKTVVSTIHQPSSAMLDMFDKVLLMAEGRVAFLGTVHDACAFFRQMGVPCPNNYNPADFFLQLLAVVPNREETGRKTVEMVCDAFDRSEAGIKLVEETEIKSKMGVSGGGVWGDDFFHVGGDAKRRSPYKASWLAQFRAVVWRSWKSVIKNRKFFQFRFFLTILMAVLVGILFYGQVLDDDGVMNINAVLFIILTRISFQNAIGVLEIFCSELPVFMREHLNGTYRVDVYFLGKNLAEMPITVLFPVSLTTIIYFMVGLNPHTIRFFTSVFIAVLISDTAVAFGYLMSCATGSLSVGMSLTPQLVFVFSILGGFFLNSGSVPIYYKWLSYLSMIKYGYETLMINQWAGIDNIDCTDFSNETCPQNGHVILETLSFRENDFFMDIACLFALMVGYRIVAFLLLLCRTLRRD